MPFLPKHPQGKTRRETMLPAMHQEFPKSQLLLKSLIHVFNYMDGNESLSTLIALNRSFERNINQINTDSRPKFLTHLGKSVNVSLRSEEHTSELQSHSF